MNHICYCGDPLEKGTRDICVCCCQNTDTKNNDCIYKVTQKDHINCGVCWNFCKGINDLPISGDKQENNHNRLKK